MKSGTRLWMRLLAGAVLGAAALGGGAARGDIIELKDGTKISGSMARKDDVMVITRDAASGGGTVYAAPGDVVRVTLVSTVTPAEKAESDWTRALVELKKADKFGDMVAVLEKFVGTHGSTPAGENARTMLANAKAIAEQSPVKFRGRWVPTAQVEVIQKEGEEKARPAVAAYKAGRLKDALDAAKDALKADEDNPTALIVQGLANYRLNKLQESRASFLKVVDGDAAQVLALNNLGVLGFQMKRDPEGIGFYARALQAAPENRLVLDNITEALHAYSGNRQATVYRDLERQYTQAETALEAKLSKKNQFRFGSTWVTQEQKDRINANKAAITTAMSDLETQYNAAAIKSDTIDSQIKQAQADYDAAQNDYVYWNSQMGVLLPGGSIGYDPAAGARRDQAGLDMERARRRVIALQDQRAALVDAVKKMRLEAQKLKTQLASAEKETFTGVQRILDLGEDEAVPPPTAVNVPPKVEAVPVVKVEVPAPVVPEREPRNYDPGYGYGGGYLPVFPFPGVGGGGQVVVLPGGGKGPIVVPPGGIIVVPGAPAPSTPNVPVVPAKPPESRKLKVEGEKL